MTISNCWEFYNQIITKKTTSGKMPYIILHGPPGTGKTTQAYKVAGNRPVYSVTVTEDMMDAQFIGHYIPKGSEFEWHDGPAIKAWREGGLLIINEIDRAGASVITSLYAICDDKEIAALTLPTGETVRPHKNFFIIATTNAVPETLPEALADRFPIKLYVDKPHPDAIKSLPENFAKVVVESYKSINEDGEVPVTFREVKAFHKLVEAGVPMEVAGVAILGSRAYDFVNVVKIGVREDTKEAMGKVLREKLKQKGVNIDYDDDEDEDSDD